MTETFNGQASELAAPPAPPVTHLHFVEGNDGKVWPLDWCEKGLCWLYEHRREVWAEMALAIHDCDIPTRRRASKR